MADIRLTEEMRETIGTALADGLPVMVASSSKAGIPDIVFKGSTMVWDEEHLAFWERSHGQTLRNLEENPNICLLYRNPARRLVWKFFGHAELHRDDALRQQIMGRTVEAELARDPERKGIGVLIRVDKVLQGPTVLMQRGE